VFLYCNKPTVHRASPDCPLILLMYSSSVTSTRKNPRSLNDRHRGSSLSKLDRTEYSTTYYTMVGNLVAKPAFSMVSLLGCLNPVCWQNHGRGFDSPREKDHVDASRVLKARSFSCFP
jgi:hypothetical protein